MSEDINTGTTSEALNDKSDSSAIRQRIKEIKMYAKIINEETKQCDVGTGTNTEFYKSIGMTEMDVEQAYDGSWYVKGFAPEQPLPTNEEQSENRRQAYIAETDPIQIHIDRLKDKEQTPEIIAEIESLRAERDEKIAAIKAKYPYSE